MASLGEVNILMSTIFSVFTPSMIKITSVRNNKTSIYTYNTALGNTPRLNMFEFLRKNKLTTEVTEISITTTPGTIRQASASYDRKADKSCKIMNLDIEVLKCLPSQKEVQQVVLRENKLSRNGSMTEKLPLERLRKHWHEDNRRRGIQMPTPIPNVVLKKSKRSSIYY